MGRAVDLEISLTLILPAGYKCADKGLPVQIPTSNPSAGKNDEIGGFVAFRRIGFTSVGEYFWVRALALVHWRELVGRRGSCLGWEGFMA